MWLSIGSLKSSQVTLTAKFKNFWPSNLLLWVVEGPCPPFLPLPEGQTGISPVIHSPHWWVCRLCLRGGRRCQGVWAPGYSSRHTRGRVKGAPLSIGDLPADTILCLCRAPCPPGETQPHMKRVRGEEVKASKEKAQCASLLLAGSWTSEGYRQYQVSCEICEQGQELVCIWIFKTNLHEWREISVIWQVYSCHLPKSFNNNINKYLIKIHFPDAILTPFYVTRDLRCYNEYFNWFLFH